MLSVVRRLSIWIFMFSKIQIDWRKKEWHITTDVRTGSGVSGKKPRKAMEVTPEQYHMLMQGLEIVAKRPIEELTDPPKTM